MEKETLGEAAERHYINCIPSDRHSFIAGAKYQAERMYSAEEVVDLIADWTKMAKGLNMNFPADKFEQWFEQFKKK